MGTKDWTLIYAKYEGAQKRAVDLVYRELGTYLTRDVGVYSFHAVACTAQAQSEDGNQVFFGTYNDHAVFKEHFAAEEIPVNGYAVKVCDAPQHQGCKQVLLCGFSQREIFYAAAEFVDDYFTKAAPLFDAHIRLRNEMLEYPLPDYKAVRSPSFQTRSIFTWGHPISDYQQYFENMARLKLNQVILWNDHLPLNADEIVSCAHSYGIEVLWGFSWGWDFNCKDGRVRDLEGLKNEIVSEYNRTYAGVKGDGIYFQSFTELTEDAIDGIPVSEAVTQLVNMTAEEILRIRPSLHLQFGLHASSVKDRLFDIARVDGRVEILWEDCGSFPYKALPQNERVNPFDSLEESEAQYPFADKMIDLRGGAPMGIVYKCMLTMDWSRKRVTHQPGRYVLGVASDATKRHDEGLLRNLWRYFSAEWIENGEYVYRLTRHIREKSEGKAAMCMAGMFSGGVWYPMALCAELFWDCREDFSAIRKRVLLRNWIRY